MVWARAVATELGAPIPGRPDHVRISLTQTELARLGGCSAGTVAWYLRCLGPAVGERRGGIVIDLGVLDRLADTASPPATSPRTAAVHQALIDCFGQHDAAGFRL